MKRESVLIDVIVVGRLVESSWICGISYLWVIHVSVESFILFFISSYFIIHNSSNFFPFTCTILCTIFIVVLFLRIYSTVKSGFHLNVFFTLKLCQMFMTW